MQQPTGGHQTTSGYTDPALTRVCRAPLRTSLERGDFVFDTTPSERMRAWFKWYMGLLPFVMFGGVFIIIGVLEDWTIDREAWSFFAQFAGVLFFVSTCMTALNRRVLDGRIKAAFRVVLSGREWIETLTNMAHGWPEHEKITEVLECGILVVGSRKQYYIFQLQLKDSTGTAYGVFSSKHRLKRAAVALSKHLGVPFAFSWADPSRPYHAREWQQIAGRLDSCHSH